MSFSDLVFTTSRTFDCVNNIRFLMTRDLSHPAFFSVILRDKFYISFKATFQLPYACVTISSPLIDN